MQTQVLNNVFKVTKNCTYFGTLITMMHCTTDELFGWNSSSYKKCVTGSPAPSTQGKYIN